MILARDRRVTSTSAHRASVGSVTRENIGGPAGVWTLDGAAIVASDADGPATVLVPSEAVRLLAVDLPLASRAKRLAALPFAIEDRIAEPVESVHIALGVELSPRRYLVGVVRHDRMIEWIARVEAEGLDHAALVPDCLALPVPGEGEWAVDLGETRAVVRSGDGTGFAIPAALLRTAWESAGKPAIIGYGAPLPADMRAGDDALALDPLGRRLLAPALDLRQGAYARRRRGLGSYGKRFAKVAALGVLAHAGIAAADTIALAGIADRREEATKALVQSVAPGTDVSGDDFATRVTDLLPQPGTGGGANPFLGTASRIAAALSPLGPDVDASRFALQNGRVVMDVPSTEPGFAARVEAALRGAGLAAQVTTTADGVRISAPAA